MKTFLPENRVKTKVHTHSCLDFDQSFISVLGYLSVSIYLVYLCPAVCLYLSDIYALLSVSIYLIYLCLYVGAAHTLPLRSAHAAELPPTQKIDLESASL